jgi:hypothetical protein
MFASSLVPSALAFDSSLPLSHTVIPGLVPGTHASAARAVVWRAGAPIFFTVS